MPNDTGWLPLHAVPVGALFRQRGSIVWRQFAYLSKAPVFHRDPLYLLVTRKTVLRVDADEYVEVRT